MTNLFIVIVVLIFAALIYGFYLMQKRHLKFSTRVFTALFVGILLVVSYRRSLELARSDHPITRVDHNGGERLCSTAANVDHAIGFVSIVGAFTKMKESEKSKNQLYCVGYFVGHDSNRCTDRNRDGYVVWFRRCEFY